MTVTTTVAGRSYTKATDAWGNVLKSTDPVSEVSYVYSSCGKPSAVKAAGATTTFAYDDVANQISMTDPDAGTTTYTYAADGKILSEKDARGVKTVNTYDNEGRLVSSLIGNTKLTHTYGNSGNESNRLVRSEYGKNSVSYVYDEYGRVISENRNVFGKGTFNFSYAYNDKNQLVQVTYPGGLSVSYTYDELGNKIQTTAGNDVIWKLKDYNGLTTSSVFNGKLTTVRTLDSNGFEKNIKLANGSSAIENFDESYDAITGNLLSRQRNSNTIERFGYDALDRLVSVSKGSVEVMKVNYAENGNIKYKTGIGNYTYNASNKPHAVSMVDNTDKQISTETVSTEFNEWNKISKISDASGHEMSVDYGPDGLRWLSTLKNGNNVARTVVYADDYEQITENGVTRDFYYLDGNTIVIRQGGTIKAFQAFTDNLGSILSVVDKDGNKVFDASYDAWGKQTVTVNTIGLHRGYCGHEMLPEFDLINMNGRLYDPTIGRFLSPDNFVQEPENSQNFNRYTYCLNNPLKYTDPSGNFFGIDDAIFVGIVMGAANGLMQASMKGDNVWLGALIGGAVGGLTSWGSQVMAVATHANNVWAGALIGAGTGAGLGAASTLITSGLNNVLNGRKFTCDMLEDLGSSALFGGLEGAVSGGITAYEKCKEAGINPWNGKENATRKNHSNIVECQKQPDPTKHCYAYAGNVASTQIGKPQSPESILMANEYAPGKDVAESWSNMPKKDCRVLDTPLYHRLRGQELKQFVNAFDRRKMTLEYTANHHVVTLAQFDTVIAHNWFGSGSKMIMDNIWVFDSLWGRKVPFNNIYQALNLIH